MRIIILSALILAGFAAQAANNQSSMSIQATGAAFSPMQRRITPSANSPPAAAIPTGFNRKA